MTNTTKSLAYYMSLPYRIELYPEEDGTFTAAIPDLPGCLSIGDTSEEALAMITEAKELWLETALADEDYIPEPAPVLDETYSGKFVVRLPKTLHRRLAQLAKAENTSLNQMVNILLADSVGRWTEKWSIQSRPKEVLSVIGFTYATTPKVTGRKWGNQKLRTPAVHPNVSHAAIRQ